MLTLRFYVWMPICKIMDNKKNIPLTCQQKYCGSLSNCGQHFPTFQGIFCPSPERECLFLMPCFRFQRPRYQISEMLNKVGFLGLCSLRFVSTNRYHEKNRKLVTWKWEYPSSNIEFAIEFANHRSKLLFVGPMKLVLPMIGSWRHRLWRLLLLPWTGMLVRAVELSSDQCRISSQTARWYLLP